MSEEVKPVDGIPETPSEVIVQKPEAVTTDAVVPVVVAPAKPGQVVVEESLVPPPRVPMVGDSVWYIFPESADFQPLPATLYQRNPDGSWGLNYHREGVLVFNNGVSYCGTDWSAFQWCWPGEFPDNKG